MIPTTILRSRIASAAILRGPARASWQTLRGMARTQAPISTRFYSDIRKPDATGPVPAAPVTSSPAPPDSSIKPNSPPVGEFSPATPKPRKSRVKRFFTWCLILAALGYAGGVYYALVSDNWRDFFTEYVPLGEEIVAYLEEQEFQKRIQSSSNGSKLYPQIRGEQKVTIPGKSGVFSRPVIEGSSSVDLASEGRHVSALDAPVPAAPSVTASAPKPAAPAGKSAKKTIDKLQLPESAQGLVSDVAAVLNNMIDFINADGVAHKYEKAIESAKKYITKIGEEIHEAKKKVEQSTDDRIEALHKEFNEAALQLKLRNDLLLEEVNSKWRDEYTAEIERISQGYENKVKAEVERLAQLHEQEVQNKLLEQSIQLNRQFSATVQERVEAEREGRLSKLIELEDDVLELEKLTAEWNSVVDANLQTQRLIVAVEALRAKLDNADRPTPFVNNLVAVTEIAAENPVISAAIASMHPSAYQVGIPTSAQLIDRFRRVAAEVRKAALLPEDAGVASHIASVALSKVMFKKQGFPEGNDVESVLARTELFLEEGNLDQAAREMNGLNGWAKTLSRDWLSECRKVLEVRQALDVISTEARLKSLLVN